MTELTFQSNEYSVHLIDITMQIKSIMDITPYETFFEKPIKVFKVNGVAFNPIPNEFFNIYIHSSPNLVQMRPTYWAKTTLFEKRWTRGDSSFFPIGEGKYIYDYTRTPVAQLIEDNLYIFHNLRHFENSNRADAKVLMLLLRAMYDRNERPNIISKEEQSLSKEELFNKKRNDFVDFCKDMEFKKQAYLQSDVNSHQNMVKRLSAQLIEASRNLREAERALVHYKSDIEEQIEVYKREFDRIKNISKVFNVAFDKNGRIISVMTDDLFCENPKTKLLHYLGKYNIKINMSQQYSQIQFLNLTRTIGGKHHPHVTSNGSACLGNFSEAMPQLVGRNEFAILITMAIKFLESVNVEDSWGSTIVNWPLASTVKLTVKPVMAAPVEAVLETVE